MVWEKDQTFLVRAFNCRILILILKWCSLKSHYNKENELFFLIDTICNHNHRCYNVKVAALLLFNHMKIKYNRCYSSCIPMKLNNNENFVDCLHLGFSTSK